jgi:D-glycero-alpha-D-manno-heptose-7-phosphate kinase
MIISRTPLRISFFGGGTDNSNFYSKSYGAVLTTAIKKYVFVAVSNRFNNDIRVNYSQIEIVDSPAKIQHNIARQVLLNTGIGSKTEITSIGEIPGHGTGLGSSSSFAVGLLNAAYDYLGKPKPQEALAEEACDIEINQLKKPIGKQDQYAAALGGLRYIRFNADGSVRTEIVNLSEDTRKTLEDSLLSFYIPQERDSDEILRHQNSTSKINENMNALERMREQAEEGRKYLKDGDLEPFGKLLNEAWILKRGLSNKISNSVIDRYYELGMSCGASGGKLSGAGGSGFLTLFAEPRHHEKIRNAFKGLQPMKIVLDREGTQLVYKHKGMD